MDSLSLWFKETITVCSEIRMLRRTNIGHNMLKRMFDVGRSMHHHTSSSSSSSSALQLFMSFGLLNYWHHHTIQIN
jgi:hypothetical protein